jgi:hypothetical protein
MLLPERLPQTTNDEPTDDESPLDDLKDWIDQNCAADDETSSSP